MEGDSDTAAEAMTTLLRLQPEFSVAWVSANTALAGEMLEHVLEGLRRAEYPRNDRDPSARHDPRRPGGRKASCDGPSGTQRDRLHP
jgi:hypothetical protein